jgi:hypothetical protein
MGPARPPAREAQEATGRYAVRVPSCCPVVLARLARLAPPFLPFPSLLIRVRDHANANAGSAMHQQKLRSDHSSGLKDETGLHVLSLQLSFSLVENY